MRITREPHPVYHATVYFRSAEVRAMLVHAREARPHHRIRIPVPGREWECEQPGVYVFACDSSERHDMRMCSNNSRGGPVVEAYWCLRHGDGEAVAKLLPRPWAAFLPADQCQCAFTGRAFRVGVRFAITTDIQGRLLDVQTKMVPDIRAMKDPRREVK